MSESRANISLDFAVQSNYMTFITRKLAELLDYVETAKISFPAKWTSAIFDLMSRHRTSRSPFLLFYTLFYILV